MTRILDQLPITERDDVAFVGNERVAIKAHEIIVWVSVSVRTTLDLPPGTVRFPAVLDTGHTHYFSIWEQHLVRWGRFRPDMLRLLGHVRQSGRRIPLHAANLWLYPNVRGERDQHQDRQPQLLEINRGIAVYPDEAGFPRLPLIGLRTVQDNRLHVTIDGERHKANLRTPDWRTKLLRWLA